jgi:nitrous-oxide reductase
MELLYDFPTYPEPHYAEIILASKLHPEKLYPLAENHDPYAVKTAEDTRVVRKGNRVDVYMISIRTHFTPDVIRVVQGDEVFFHDTNLEQDADITHGFGILGSNCDMQVEPGETKTMRWVAERAGITPFYCSNFCSALHQEMQGYIEVAPAGARVASVQRPAKSRVAEDAALVRR